MRFVSLPEANIYKALLESGGIEAFINGEAAHDIFPYGGYFELELQVRRADEARAKEMLSAKFDREELKHYKMED